MIYIASSRQLRTHAGQALVFLQSQREHLDMFKPGAREWSPISVEKCQTF